MPEVESTDAYRAMAPDFAKPSFRTSVAAKLKAGDIGNAPVICKTR